MCRSRFAGPPCPGRSARSVRESREPWARRTRRNGSDTSLSHCYACGLPGRLAQLGERRLDKAEVTGSSPVSPTSRSRALAGFSYPRRDRTAPLPDLSQLDGEVQPGPGGVSGQRRSVEPSRECQAGTVAERQSGVTRGRAQAGDLAGVSDREVVDRDRAVEQAVIDPPLDDVDRISPSIRDAAENLGEIDGRERCAVGD